MTRYVSALVIFVHIGHSVVSVLCLYILLINIFSPCIVGGRKVTYCIRGSFLDIFWEPFWTDL